MIALLLRHRFKLLLAMLLLAIVGAPVLADATMMSHDAGQRVVSGLNLVLSITAILAAGGTRAVFVWLLVLVIPSLILDASAFIWPGQFSIAVHLLRMVFLVMVVVQMMRQLFATTLITFDTLCASLCVYMILGLVWMNAYVVHETLKPGCYVTTAANTQDDADQSVRLLYFSFTTLTTVGYGDIVPRSNGARMLAITEALTGQSFLLIMVSRLVGIHVAQATVPATPLPDSSKKGGEVR